MSEVVSHEQAEKEVNGWLDLKKVKAKKRKQYEESIETMIEAVMDGSLSIDENGNLTQVLSFPIGDSQITELKYKLRASVSEVREFTKGVKPEDGEGRMLAVAAGLTGKAAATIEKMDSTDYGFLSIIVLFYM